LSDVEIKELAREILARDEYARWREEPGVISEWLISLSEALRSLAAWLRDHMPSWLSDLFSELSEPASAESLDPLVSVLGVISLVLVALLGASLVRAWASQSAGRGRGGSPTPEAPGEDLRVRADTLAGEGRFLEAAHAVQLAALQLLLERRWLVLDRFEPNRTLRARLAASRLPESERAGFAGLLDGLEAHWFGDREADRGLFDSWCTLHERLAALGEAP
jgi:hypothetical protein